MDENLTTSGEPMVVESANTSDISTAGYAATLDDGSTVIETATPMDNNVTYNNVPVETNVMEPTTDTSKTYADNLYDAAVTTMHDNASDENAGSAMKNFFLKDYDYDIDEVGSYWVGGAMNDVKNQMSFLNVLINEEMYDALDLQKYYFDNNLATARAYAAKKEKEVAYNYYRAAQEKAISEGELTGWYMPAEGRYMLGQYTIAMNVLENPNSTPEERNKAEKVKGTVEDWFGANKISTKGIKTLGMMNYEETVRHNKITAELQKQANAASAASANWANKLQMFDLHQMEIVWRMDFDDDNIIGHTDEERRATGSDLIRYLNTKSAWEGTYKYAPTRNEAWIDGTAEKIAKLAGADVKGTSDNYYSSMYDGMLSKLNGNEALKYDQMQSLGSVKFKNTAEIIKVTDEDNNTYTVKGSELDQNSDVKFITTYNDDTDSFETRVYVKKKDGTVLQVMNHNAKLKSDKTISELISERSNGSFTSDKLQYDGKTIKVGNKAALSLGDYQSTKEYLETAEFYNMNEKQKDGYLKAVGEMGLTREYGYLDTKGNNFGVVFSETDSEGKKTYYQLQQNGKISQIDNKKVIKVELNVSNDDERHQIGMYGQDYTYTNANGKTLSSFWQGSHLFRDIMEASEKVGELKNGMSVYEFTDANGRVTLLSGIGEDWFTLSNDDIKTMKWNKGYSNIDELADSRESYINNETDIVEKEYSPNDLLRSVANSSNASKITETQQAEGSSYSGYDKKEVALIDTSNDKEYNPNSLLDTVQNTNDINKVKEGKKNE